MPTGIDGGFMHILKQAYNDAAIQNLLLEEIESQRRYHREAMHGIDKAADEMLALRRPALTATGLVALTTFAGLEWLRHRKAEVAAAEQSGDYSSLVAEFCEWLRALIRAWREAAQR